MRMISLRDKRGDEAEKGGTWIMVLLVIVIGAFVVYLIWGIITGKIGSFISSNLESKRQSCNLACSTNQIQDYCLTSDIKINSDEYKSINTKITTAPAKDIAPMILSKTLSGGILKNANCKTLAENSSDMGLQFESCSDIASC